MTDLQDELIIEKALRRDAVVRVRELTAERDELKAQLEAAQRATAEMSA